MSNYQKEIQNSKKWHQKNNRYEKYNSKIHEFIWIKIKKKDPFPNTFIPIDVLDPILFKLLSLNEKLKCILLSNENFLDGDIINKNLKNIKSITNFEYIDFECQEFLNKDNNIIVIKNKIFLLTI